MVSRSRSRLVSGFGFRVCGFWSGLVFIVFRFSFVFHISGVTVFVSAVSDDLSAAVGKSDAVRSSDNFAVAGLLLCKVVVGRSILNFVSEAEWHRGLQT